MIRQINRAHVVRTIFIIGLVVLGLAAAGPVPVWATDAVVGNGTPASCTEAEFDSALAVVQASGDGELSFNCGGPATIIFTSQKVIDTQLITINGGGVITLSGANSTRLFHVVAGAFELRNITLTNGFSGDGYGGAVLAEQGSSVYVINSTIQNSRTNANFAGGAILSFATQTTIPTVSIENSTIQGNESNYGAINTVGKLVVTGSLIQGNIGPSGSTLGGGLTVGGPTTITDTEFRNNEASDGAAFYATATAVVEMTGGLITANDASGYGGGINNQGLLTLTYVTIANNTAYAGGGISNVGSAHLNRVTMEGNFAADKGGAILNDYGSDMAVLNSTITGNDAYATGGSVGAGLAANRGMLIFQNATLWNNAPDPDAVSIYNYTGEYLTFGETIMGGDLGYQCSGERPTASNFSLFEDTSCDWQSGSGNIVQPNLTIGSLRDNGGPTWTMMPPPDSPAVDAGQCNLPEDQRGVPRPQGLACDIGSVERQLHEASFFIYLPITIN